MEGGKFILVDSDNQHNQINKNAPSPDWAIPELKPKPLPGDGLHKPDWPTTQPEPV